MQQKPSFKTILFNFLKMPTFFFLTAICLLVATSLLETDASPKTNTKLEKEPSSAANAESTSGQPPQNRWATPDKKLALIETDGLIAEHNGEKEGKRSVRAEQAIPKGNSGIFYYEVKILEKPSGTRIGLTTKQMPLNERVGEYEGTYAYSNIGSFWGHKVDRRSKIENGRPLITGTHIFKQGNVVGCGVDLKTRQIIYTLNGVRLETAQMLVDSAAELYPCVSLYKPGTIIEANFGPEFEFKIAEAFRN